MPNFNNIDLGIINGPSRNEWGIGSLISIKQSVSRGESGSGSLISIKQNVSDSGSGSLIDLAQVVYNTATSTFFTRNGWYPYLYINGSLVPASQISGPIKVVRNENDAAIMDFVLIPPRGSIDLTAYEGRSVFLNVQVGSSVYRVYTGKVNIPTLDINERKLAISCTDNRRELINQNYPFIVDSLGYYSSNIFGTAKDKSEELDNRLTTVPYTLNFNVYAIPTISSSFAAASPTFTFHEGDIYRDGGRDPKIVLTPRSKVVNTVDIVYEYRYQRLYFAYCNYQWSTNIDCDFLTKGYSQTKRSLIESAASAAGWPLDAAITFATTFRNGFYNCGGVTVGFSWIETGYTNVPKTQTTRDSTGALVTTPVLDGKGNPVYVAVPTSSIDHSKEFCDSAQWNAFYRWSQNISEKYTCTVEASASVARFGTVSSNESGGIDSTYDSKVWEDLKQPTPTAGNTKVYGGSGLAYYWNEAGNYTLYANDMYTLLNKAKTTILKSHRENYITFNKFIDPRIDLAHTVLLDISSHENTDIYAKGKVYSITHTMDPTEGSCNTEVTLALSVSSGTVSNSTLALPTRPSNNNTHEGFNIILGNHYGEDPTNHPEWNGFIGNKFKKEAVIGGNNTFKTQYPESFVVDTPTIEDTYRSNVSLTGTASYDVNIVDDDLTVVL